MGSNIGPIYYYLFMVKQKYTSLAHLETLNSFLRENEAIRLVCTNSLKGRKTDI